MKQRKRAATRKKATKTPSIIKIFLVVIVLFVSFATIFKITETVIRYTNDGFPKLEISLKDVPIEKIDAGTKDIKYPDNTVTITVNNKITHYSDVEIKGRGNFTWSQPKKPYQIKFSNKTSLFNYKSTKKWVLLADYGDYTHLRNDTVFKIAELLDKNHTRRGNYVELYIDDTYRGLYYVVEKISIDKASVDLKNEYGIIVELDNNYGKVDGCNSDSKENCIVEKDVVNQDYSAFAMEDFISSLNSLYEAVSNKNYTLIKEIIDINSFANYYLLNEFSANPDAYTSSFYMYKDGKESKIYAGPVWDFDMALSNKSWSDNTNLDPSKIHSPFETMALKNPTDFLDESEETQTYKTSTILYDLMDIPEFHEKVKEVYQTTLSGRKEELLNHIKSQANYIKNAVLRDQSRWKLQYNFNEEIDYLVDWITKRYDYFEEVYGDKPNIPTNLDLKESNSDSNPAPKSQPLSKE